MSDNPSHVDYLELVLILLIEIKAYNINATNTKKYNPIKYLIRQTMGYIIFITEKYAKDIKISVIINKITIELAKEPGMSIPVG